jgi:hypothetical protein
VIQEAGYAIAERKELVFLVEKGIRPIPQLQGDLEEIRFDRKNLSKAYINFNQMLYDITHRRENIPKDLKNNKELKRSIQKSNSVPNSQKVADLQYTPQAINNLDTLIKNGEQLTSWMQRPDFHQGQMGQDVRQWLDEVEHSLWEDFPKLASNALSDQGDVTPDEKMRYQGWNWGAASLRISVDRRLTRLRAIKSQIVNSEEVFSSDASWSQQTISDDKSKLGERLYSRDHFFLFDGLKQTDSFMEMTVSIINAAIFPILIDGVKGRFSIAGQECAQVAEMKSKTRIPHGEHGNIRIRQHLSQEMVNRIVGMHVRREPLKIDLKSCELVVIPEVNGKPTIPLQVSLAKEFHVPTPELTWTNK